MHSWSHCTTYFLFLNTQSKFFTQRVFQLYLVLKSCQKVCGRYVRDFKVIISFIFFITLCLSCVFFIPT